MASAKPRHDSAEFRLAEEVQKSLIPEPISREEIEVDVRYHPAAHLGGDYAALSWAGEKRLYLTICDVMGHGIAAALLANRVNSEVRRLTQIVDEPGELMIQLNQFIHKHFVQTRMFVTFACVLLDFETKSLLHAGAAHPPALIVSADGSRAEWLESQCTVIGPYDSCCQFKDPQIRTSIKAGDVLLLYTDGITETMNDGREQFGKERLKEVVFPMRARSAPAIADALFDRVNTWRSGPVEDDILLLIAKVK